MRRIFPIVCLLALLAVPAAQARNVPQRIKRITELAVARERAVLDALEQTPPDWEQARSKLDLELAVGSLISDEAAKAVREGTMDAGSGSRISAAGKELEVVDKQAYRAAGDRDAQAAKTALERGLALKERIFLIVSGVVETARCSTEKQFDVYAIPDGYQSSYAEVYPHGIPKDAKNVHVRFVDAVTGKPAPAEPFSGQTWTSTVKGYQPNGKFVVRVDLTGTGFGKPDANKDAWKVVVTWDC